MAAEELLTHVWDEHADPFTETVRVTVGTLRRKLGTSDGRPLIETVLPPTSRAVTSHFHHYRGHGPVGACAE